MLTMGGAAPAAPVSRVVATQVFTSEGVFTVPEGVTRLESVLVSGGSRGGDGGSGEGHGGGGAGGGGGGGVLECSLPVVPGERLTVVPGKGGDLVFDDNIFTRAGEGAPSVISLTDADPEEVGSYRAFSGVVLAGRWGGPAVPRRGGAPGAAGTGTRGGFSILAFCNGQAREAPGSVGGAGSNGSLDILRGQGGLGGQGGAPDPAVPEGCLPDTGRGGNGGNGANGTPPGYNPGEPGTDGRDGCVVITYSE
ncbi:hypothetical protein [Streptomyces uncialis]|uniref:glycine-rich domain-containing protein n=1 Tax=Streptomyces uncialis TaxID=1048205 RepID=UPI003864FF00|nr:hypothetical protein OG268_06030 [Streptomyces uncialis]